MNGKLQGFNDVALLRAAGSACCCVFLVEFPLIDGRLAPWAGWIWALLIAAPFVTALFVFQQRAKRAGAASGTFNTFQQVGFSLGVAVSSVLLFSRTGAVPTDASLEDAVRAGLWVMVAAFFLADVTSLLLPKPGARRHLVSPAEGVEVRPETVRT